MKKLIVLLFAIQLFSSCEKEEETIKYTSVTITGVVVNSFDQYNVVNGTSNYWDSNGGIPDPYLVLFDDDLKQLCSSGYKSDKGKADLPQNFYIDYVNKYFTIYDLSKSYSIMIRDYDGSDSFEVMGWMELPINKYYDHPSTVTIYDEDLKPGASVTVSLKWNI